MEVEILFESEKKKESMFSNGGVVNARSEKERDVFRGEVFYIDLINADTVLADDLEAGEGFIDDCLGDHVIAADVSVKIPH